MADRAERNAKWNGVSSRFHVVFVFRLWVLSQDLWRRLHWDLVTTKLQFASLMRLRTHCLVGQKCQDDQWQKLQDMRTPNHNPRPRSFLEFSSDHSSISPSSGDFGKDR